MQGAQFVDQEPEPDVPRALARHQRIDRGIEPQREQLREHAHVDVAGRQEQDRARSSCPIDPLADRKGLPVFGQHLERLGIDIEHCTHRFRHARRARRADGTGHGIFDETVQIGEIGVHEFVGQRGVGAPPCFGEL